MVNELKYMQCKQLVAAWVSVVGDIQVKFKASIGIDENHVLSAEKVIDGIYKMDQPVLPTNGIDEVLPHRELYEAIKEINHQLLRVISSTQAGDSNESQGVNFRNNTEIKVHKLMEYKEVIVKKVTLFINCFNHLEERERVTLIHQFFNRKRDIDINFRKLNSEETIKRVRKNATIKLIEKISLESYLQDSFLLQVNAKKSGFEHVMTGGDGDGDKL